MVKYLEKWKVEIIPDLTNEKTQVTTRDPDQQVVNFNFLEKPEITKAKEQQRKDYVEAKINRYMDFYRAEKGHESDHLEPKFPTFGAESKI